MYFLYLPSINDNCNKLIVCLIFIVGVGLFNINFLMFPFVILIDSDLQISLMINETSSNVGALNLTDWNLLLIGSANFDKELHVNIYLAVLVVFSIILLNANCDCLDKQSELSITIILWVNFLMR